MPTLKIAHIRQQGQDIIIIPLDRSFGAKTTEDQHSVISDLQFCAQSAGLAGTVVPVWQSGSGFKFIAPTPWKSFFQSLTWNQIIHNRNKTLTCG